MVADLIKRSFQKCIAKRVYFSEEFALKVAKRIKKERGDSLRVYWCNQCTAFHLTKKDPANSAVVGTEEERK